MNKYKHKYKHLLYKRGFLLTDISDISFEDSMTKQIFKKWNHMCFGEYIV